ncbi:MAG: Two-component transcriptional response regulator, LuxR family [uncultured Thermomicrobiales bacterium]|uniref:Two-component transcriptional response regulator, LuxR family n=1 Tax=uncultured Thermomicrobiales bacterium TaxID=1645740 RepID=A0A6J4UCA0_9BACT|nr:MAG: Two-component transcriptional response regulator, LuxR family [uncultured Thermomicrobiales bacterium]
MIRVLLVDDQPLARAGLKMILDPADGFEIVAECDDGEAALEVVERLRGGLDVVVMDVRMRRMDGVEATRRLRASREGPPILILTTFDDDEILSAALRAGASGFLLKDAPAEDLIRATRSVAEGGAWLDPAVTGRVLAGYRAGGATGGVGAAGAARIADLTPRELEVLRLIGRGATNQEIADSLFIGEATVKSHIGRILDKLELRDRPAAIVFAFDHGLVQPES